MSPFTSIPEVNSKGWWQKGSGRYKGIKRVQNLRVYSSRDHYGSAKAILNQREVTEMRQLRDRRGPGDIGLKPAAAQNSHGSPDCRESSALVSWRHTAIAPAWENLDTVLEQLRNSPVRKKSPVFWMRNGYGS